MRERPWTLHQGGYSKTDMVYRVFAAPASHKCWRPMIDITAGYHLLSLEILLKVETNHLKSITKPGKPYNVAGHVNGEHIILINLNEK